MPRLYDEIDLRLSYVVWQEGVNPLVVVEFLSPGTAKEDLGENIEVVEDEGLNSSDEAAVTTVSEAVAAGRNGRVKEKPPRKWEVYERILRVPYYVVLSRYTNG